MEVALDAIPVLFLRSPNGIAGSAKTFITLEAKLPTIKQRKFYGLVWGVPPKEEYWACVATIDTDNAQAMELEMGTVPGGLYVQKKIPDWNKNLKLIGETFRELAHTYDVDDTRPSIEFYRSSKELIIRMPIKK